MDTQKMLETMASSFQCQIDKDYSCNIQLHIEDTKERYSIKVEKGEVQVTKSPISHVDGELTTTSGMLNNIIRLSTIRLEACLGLLARESGRSLFFPYALF